MNSKAKGENKGTVLRFSGTEPPPVIWESKLFLIRIIPKQANQINDSDSQWAAPKQYSYHRNGNKYPSQN